MTRQIVIVFALLLGLLLVACGGTEEYPPEVTPTVEGKADAPGCTYKCVKCLPPNAPACEYLCVYIGKCDTRCRTFEYCDVGYVWNGLACRCLPDK